MFVHQKLTRLAETFNRSVITRQNRLTWKNQGHFSMTFYRMKIALKLFCEMEIIDKSFSAVRIFPIAVPSHAGEANPSAILARVRVPSYLPRTGSL